MRMPLLARILRTAPLCLLLIDCQEPSGATGAGEPMTNWKAGKGQLSTQTDPDGRSVLQWTFTYEKEPMVLSQRAGAAFRSMNGISFQARSDRKAPLFLRFDERGGKVFLARVDVSTAWEPVSLSIDQLQPFAGAKGPMNPARLSMIYIVDLNGKDEGATGRRTIWFKGFQPRYDASALGSRTARIPLVGYDADGKVLGLADYRRRGVSAGQWCFVTGPEGFAVPNTVAEETVDIDGRSVKVPVLHAASDSPLTLHVLFWEVGDAAKVWLEADGGGRGLQDALTGGKCLLNLELARTRLRRLEEYLQGCSPAVVDAFRPRVQAVAQDLRAAVQPTSLPRLAARADAALKKLLEISRRAVVQQSRAVLTARCEPKAALPAPPELTGSVAAGARLTIELREPEFLLGFSQSFGFTGSRMSDAQIHRLYKEVRAAGFNHYVMPTFWDQIVDGRGNNISRQWEAKLRARYPVDLGCSLQTHGIVQVGRPEYVKSMRAAEFTKAARGILRSSALDYRRRFGDRMVLWEAINEPSSNAFSGIKAGERVRVVSDLIAELRAVVPQGRILVNDYNWQRGIDAKTTWEDRDVISTYRFYKELLQQPVTPDVLGLEWYPGARIDRREFRLNFAEPCMDLLDTSRYWDRLIALGRPLFISEFNVPGAMRPGDANGYAWGRWTPATQAQAAEEIFLLALSKPQVIGCAWWSITDAEPWNREGGLFTGDGKRKPVMDRLSKVIAELRRPVGATVANPNEIPFPSLPGLYRVSDQTGKTWTLRRSQSGTLTAVALRPPSE